MPVILRGEYTFVTNNMTDFIDLFRHETIHAGLVVFVPNAPPARQREMFQAVLAFIQNRDLVNTLLTVNYDGCVASGLPPK